MCIRDSSKAWDVKKVDEQKEEISRDEISKGSEWCNPCDHIRSEEIRHKFGVFAVAGIETVHPTPPHPKWRYKAREHVHRTVSNRITKWTLQYNQKCIYIERSRTRCRPSQRLLRQWLTRDDRFSVSCDSSVVRIPEVWFPFTFVVTFREVLPCCLLSSVVSWRTYTAVSYTHLDVYKRQF